MPDTAAPIASRRSRLLWSGALGVLALLAGAAAEARGRAARVPFSATEETGPLRVAMVGNAADAYRIWRAAELRGRRLVVLTGQWSKPRNLSTQPPTPEELAASRAGGDLEFLDAQSALFSAGRVGMVRAFDVVMPPAAFSQRLGEVRGQKELERADGAFGLRFNGMERRFYTPRAFSAPPETVLVLVEPSWFTEGAPRDPLAWLAERGVQWDLALFALDDPAAGGEERQAALAFAQTTGALFWEVKE